MIKLAVKALMLQLRIRSGVIVLSLFFIGMISAQSSMAQDYPNKPIRWLIGFPAGGATDVLGRVLASEMDTRLGQPIVVENKVGASGTIAVDAITKSAPDGYTLGTSGAGTSTIQFLLGPKPPYAMDDLEIIGNAGVLEFIILARKGLTYRTIAELSQAAKASPGKITYATAGSGTPGHLSIEYLMSMAGIQLLHVPYKGDTPALTDLSGGHVEIGILPIAAALSAIKSGLVVPIAVTSSMRSKLLPQVPTVAESGVLGYEASSLTLLVASRGTPKTVVDKLNAALNEALRKPSVIDRYTALGLRAVPETPQQAADYLRRENEKWSKVISDGKITVTP